MNIKITKDRKISVCQLITDVEWVDKMRKAFSINVKAWDVVPMYFMDISLAQTEKVIMQDALGNDVEVVQIKKDVNDKILYETRSNDCCLYWKQTLRQVSIELPEFEYEDL